MSVAVESVSLDVTSSASPVPPEDASPTNGVNGASHKFIAGMIYPPPDLRTMIDSTAGFVAVSANPTQFEDKIRENHRQDPKFSFLNSADPYHAYYRHRIERAKLGGDAADDEPRPAAAAAPSATVNTTNGSSSDPIPSEPPAFHFTLPVPHKGALELDILKLTALFTARRGPTFLRTLSAREGRNYQFDFLRPDHSLFSYFNRVVEQYSRILYPPTDVIEKLERLKLSSGRATILEEGRTRGAWERYQREKQSKREKERDEEAIAFAEIDWHDFAIVQTIEFTAADAHAELPRPRTVVELEAMMLAEKRMAAMISEDTAADVEAHQEEERKIAEAEATAQAAALAAAREVDEERDDVEMDVDSGDDDEEEERRAAKAREEAARQLQAQSLGGGAPMKIRKDYVPKTLASRTLKAALTTCTICGQQIPVDELEEHMRIELLDPKWKSQRDALEARRAQASELQRGANVGSALKQLARARDDLFDGDESKRKQEDEEAQARRKEREKAVWDGHTATKESTMNKYSTNVNFDEQIAAIHKAHGLGQTDTSTIGPNIGPSIPAVPVPSTLPPPPNSLPQNPTLLASASADGAVIASGPQPMQHPLPLPPAAFPGAVAASAEFVPASAIPPVGIHPARLAAMGMPGSIPGSPLGAGMTPPYGAGLPTRPADVAFGADGQMAPVAKKPRIERPEGHYYPEEDWIQLHPEPVTLSVQLPNIADKPEWKLNGAIANIPDLPLTLLVSSLRDRILAHIQSSVPVSRIKLSFRGQVLTNAKTLANYNMDDDDMIMFSVREGRK